MAVRVEDRLGMPAKIECTGLLNGMRRDWVLTHPKPTHLYEITYDDYVVGIGASIEAMPRLLKKLARIPVYKIHEIFNNREISGGWDSDGNWAEKSPREIH